MPSQDEKTTIAVVIDAKGRVFALDQNQNILYFESNKKFQEYFKTMCETYNLTVTNATEFLPEKDVQLRQKQRAQAQQTLDKGSRRAPAVRVNRQDSPSTMPSKTVDQEPAPNAIPKDKKPKPTSS